MKAKAVAAVLSKRVNENNFIKNDLFKCSFVSSSLCNCTTLIPRCLETESVLLFVKQEYHKYKPVNSSNSLLVNRNTITMLQDEALQV